VNCPYSYTEQFDEVWIADYVGATDNKMLNLEAK